jgi:hypothetical protein
MLFATGLVASACADSSRLMSPAAKQGLASRSRGALTCIVAFGPHHTVSSLRCGAAGQPRMTDMMTGGRAHTRVIVGKQAVYVNLGLSDFAFDSVGNVFSFNATIQNLMTQPLGTTDGITTDSGGAKVFFVAGPTPTSGTGTVTVMNATGTGDFTAPGQVYFGYDSLIPPDSTSPAHLWQFAIPTSANGFQFEVEVAGAIPAENSVLRWVVLRQGLTDSAYNGVWLNAPGDIYAVGQNSSFAHYTGTAWNTSAPGLAAGKSLNDVFGFGSTDIWTVGAGGFTAHFDGTSWTTVSTGGGGDYLKRVWGSSGSDVYAVGGVILHSTGAANGWTTETNPTTHALHAVWGADPSHVWATGEAGTILFSDGDGTWTTQTSGTTNALYGVWGSSATDVYAVGASGTVLHYDGASWSVSTGFPLTVTFLEDVGGSGPNDVWVVGANGFIEHYTGSWSSVTSPVGTVLLAVTSGSATAGAIVGNNGTLLNYNGASWTLSDQAGLPLFSVWASDTNNIFASSVGTVLHYDGSGWTSTAVAPPSLLNGISGSSTTDVIAVGSGNASASYDGATWTASYATTAIFEAVYDYAAGTAFAAADSGKVYVGTGTAPWTALNAPSTANYYGVWADSPTDAFFVADDGSIARYTGSTTLSAMVSNVNPADPLNAVHGRAGVDVWAVGYDGTIASYGFTGNTWLLSTSGTSAVLRGVWDAGAGDVYACGDGGTIVHYNGAGWLPMSSNVTVPLNAVHGTSETHIIVAGGSGTVLLGTR